MNIEDALALAKQYKEAGVISTSARAVMALASEIEKLKHYPNPANLSEWLKAKPGWYVKDYADGWIYFEKEEDARSAAEETGAILREVKDGVSKNV